MTAAARAAGTAAGGGLLLVLIVGEVKAAPFEVETDTTADAALQGGFMALRAFGERRLRDLLLSLHLMTTFRACVVVCRHGLHVHSHATHTAHTTHSSHPGHTAHGRRSGSFRLWLICHHRRGGEE